MIVNGIGPQNAETAMANASEKTQPGQNNFGEMLAEAIESANQLQLEKDEAVLNFTTGKETDIHKTMIALEKADVSLRLMTQVRNRLLSAFEEVMRMNV